MPKYGEKTYSGASGTRYTFTAYSLDTEFKAIGAVYIITKRTPKSGGGGTHADIYAGQTEDLSERFGGHHKADCFKRHGANCICIHPDDSEESRLEKETDLLAQSKRPCND